MKLMTISSVVAALGVAMVANASPIPCGDSSSTSSTTTPTSAATTTAAETSSDPAPSSTESAAPEPTGSSSALWQPAAGTSWQIVLSATLKDTSANVQAYDIDLFDNTAATITKIHAAGAKAICYFSAGSYEDWRSDASKFKSADLGKTLDGWAGENWLNTKSANVRAIMAARLDLAKSKGCDAVDPDNIDAYNNSNGLGLTKADAIDYINYLATEAHARGLAIGLKNSGEIVSSVIDNVEFSVNEQCAQYNECSLYSAFTAKNKPVFHIEYPKGDDTSNTKSVTAAQVKKACVFTGSTGFSTLIKNINLDSWFQLCS
ncbi:hypothetical protein H4S06_006120 [Coemansia sp. BCRC 34490]|nr:hypothetical protein H4S06_006120 [Coemansia sp. BCRC 34490]